MKAPTLYPQFKNLSFVGDTAGLAAVAGEYTLAAKYTFPVDTIIRWVTVSSEISLGNATINQGAVGILFGSSPDRAGQLTDQSASQFVFNHTTQQFLGNIYGSQRFLQIMMDDSLVITGSSVGIYIAANLITPPFANIAFAVNLSIASTPLVEWNRVKRGMA